MSYLLQVDGEAIEFHAKMKGKQMQKSVPQGLVNNLIQVSRSVHCCAFRGTVGTRNYDDSLVINNSYPLPISHVGHPRVFIFNELFRPVGSLPLKYPPQGIRINKILKIVPGRTATDQPMSGIGFPIFVILTATDCLWLLY